MKVDQAMGIFRFALLMDKKEEREYPISFTMQLKKI